MPTLKIMQWSGIDKFRCTPAAGSSYIKPVAALGLVHQQSAVARVQNTETPSHRGVVVVCLCSTGKNVEKARVTTKSGYARNYWSGRQRKSMRMIVGTAQILSLRPCPFLGHWVVNQIIKCRGDDEEGSGHPFSLNKQVPQRDLSEMLRNAQLVTT